MRRLMLAAVVIAAVVVGGIAWALHGPTGAPARYRDYLKDGAGTDAQCAKPVSERTGGWVCP